MDYSKSTRKDDYWGSVANVGAAATIISADHGFVVGDLVTYEQQTGVAKISGLVTGQTYKVASVTGTTQFTLQTLTVRL